MDAVAAVDVWPVDVPLTDRFVISRGGISVARNAFLRVRLEGGSEGYGEIAPFEALTGETREGSIAAARRLATFVVGRRASEWEAVGADLRDAAPAEPAARAGIECALVDALARARAVPLWSLWGGADVRVRETDVTIPILDEARVDELAASWYARGFRVFKLKVGEDRDADARRVERLARRYADVSFVLDANQGFDLEKALAFLDAIESIRACVVLFEQPLQRDDLEGMAELRRAARVPVAADESVATLADARRVIDAGAADCINLKITKSGLSETFAIARETRAAGLSLMIGGMMETRLGMAFSLSVALGFGGIDHLDLDTPLLMAEDPLVGGYAYDGPRLSVWNEPGVGMAPRQVPPP